MFTERVIHNHTTGPISYQQILESISTHSWSLKMKNGSGAPIWKEQIFKVNFPSVSPLRMKNLQRIPLISNLCSRAQ